MRSSWAVCGWDLAERLWMRSSQVFRASGCQCQSRNSPRIPQHPLTLVESEGRQMKQCWKTYIKRKKASSSRIYCTLYSAVLYEAMHANTVMRDRYSSSVIGVLSLIHYNVRVSYQLCFFFPKKFSFVMFIAQWKCSGNFLYFSIRNNLFQ
jgi:hypothetical protein